MTETNMYKTAARKGLKFATNRGNLALEDLFDLPMTELDRLYRELAPKVSAQDVGLLRQRTDSDDEIKLALIKDVFETKQAEADAASTRKANADKKLQILQIIERKQGDDLANKSVEELTALVNSL